MISQRNRLGDGPLFRATVEQPKSRAMTREEWVAATVSDSVARYIARENRPELGDLDMRKLVKKVREAANELRFT